jgi:hypothetical protein
MIRFSVVFEFWGWANGQSCLRERAEFSAESVKNQYLRVSIGQKHTAVQNAPAGMCQKGQMANITSTWRSTGGQQGSIFPAGYCTVCDALPQERSGGSSINFPMPCSHIGQASGCLR